MGRKPALRFAPMSIPPSASSNASACGTKKRLSVTAVRKKRLRCRPLKSTGRASSVGLF